MSLRACGSAVTDGFLAVENEINKILFGIDDDRARLVSGCVVNFIPLIIELCGKVGDGVKKAA